MGFQFGRCCLPNLRFSRHRLEFCPRGLLQARTKHALTSNCADGVCAISDFLNGVEKIAVAKYVRQCCTFFLCVQFGRHRLQNWQLSRQCLDDFRGFQQACRSFSSWPIFARRCRAILSPLPPRYPLAVVPWRRICSTVLSKSSSWPPKYSQAISSWLRIFPTVSGKSPSHADANVPCFARAGIVTFRAIND